MRSISVSRSGRGSRIPRFRGSHVCAHGSNNSKRIRCETLTERGLGAKFMKEQVQPSSGRAQKTARSGFSIFPLLRFFSLTQSDESNHSFVMDLASALWVIDRTIVVKMGVGTWEGLPQGRFYYFQAEREERRKSDNDYLTRSHHGKQSSLPNVVRSDWDAPLIQRITSEGLFRPLWLWLWLLQRSTQGRFSHSSS